MACPPITYPAIITTRVTATHLCLLLVKYPEIITGIAQSMGYDGCRRANDRAAVVIRKCERSGGSNLWERGTRGCRCFDSL
jgi:hypothetical protein